MAALDHHAGLIYVMVLVSAADADMSDQEIRSFSEEVNYLPVFRDFDASRIHHIANECVDLLQEEDGLEEALQRIRSGLPEHLYETAYAIACDVAAADGKASQEELRLLELLRDHLRLDRLIAAGIERGARARHMVR